MTLEQTKGKGIGEPDNFLISAEWTSDKSITKSGGGAIKTAKKIWQRNGVYGIVILTRFSWDNIAGEGMNTRRQEALLSLLVRNMEVSMNLV